MAVSAGGTGTEPSRASGFQLLRDNAGFRSLWSARVISVGGDALSLVALMLGRVFGNLYGAIGIAAALSYIAGGFLLDATSAPTTLLIAGTGGLLTTLVVALTLPRVLRNHTAGSDPGVTQ